MQATNPCDLCGCTEVNLHDGFYFCTECGTQDTNFQETVVEVIETGDGGILRRQAKKVVKIVEEEKEMSDSWYKWHGFNFMLKGIADELIEYGANPSFKTKLLWVWTRFIKHYLDKKEMGFDENLDDNNEFLDDKQNNDYEEDSDEDQPREDAFVASDKRRDKLVKQFTFTLLISIIYIALNLDKSPIQLTNLVKLCRDGILSLPYHLENIVPKELKPDKLRRHINRGMALFRAARIRITAMTIMKRLDLGSPVVPDLRIIVDDYLKELCLPSDLKPLVLSLMHYRTCSFMDVNAKDKLVYKIPAYELHVMTYIVWAIKLSLGLDCDYEVRLSKAAEAINEKEDRPKSYYNLGSAPTNRLFSFREWVSYYQFRMIVLRHYCYRYADKTSWDTDDYIALEHQIDEMDCEFKKDLRDEMTMDIIKRIRGGDLESTVIPKSEFYPTLTPFHTYTQVIINNLQDPEVKLRLGEDFTQYSLKYVTEDFHLVHPNSKSQKNLVKGIRERNKVVVNDFVHYKVVDKYPQNMVYVKSCDNHNWLTTNVPTKKHVTKVDTLESSDDDEDYEEIDEKVELINNNNESESKLKNDGEEINPGNESSLSNSTFSSVQFFNKTMIDTENLEKPEKNRVSKMNDTIDEIKAANMNEIKEEAENVCIFDDDFKIEKKEEVFEVNNDCGMDYENNFNTSDYFHDVPRNSGEKEGTMSDVSSLDSVNFNEATFDKAKAIKDIILITCRKHKLPVPPEYNPKKHRVTSMGLFYGTSYKSYDKKRIHPPRNITHEKERRDVWKEYITDYESAVKDDIINNITQKVNQAIQNAEQFNASNTPVDIGDSNEPTEDGVMENVTNANMNDKAQDDTTINLLFEDEDEDLLFSDASDGETHGKELLPEKDPNYDEKVYDASQLYVKAAAPTDDGEMEINPKLSEIIDKKIAKDTADPSLLTWTDEKGDDKSDSEDDMPLSMMKEFKILREKLTSQASEKLKPYVNKNVENYKYWFRFYTHLNITETVDKPFAKEINENLSTSFAFLIRQGARILGITDSILYRNLQSYEMTAVDKAKLKLKKGRSRSHMFRIVS